MGVRRFVMNVGDGSAFVRSVCIEDKAEDGVGSSVARDELDVSVFTPSAACSWGRTMNGRCRLDSNILETRPPSFLCSSASILDKEKATARGWAGGILLASADNRTSSLGMIAA